MKQNSKQALPPKLRFPEFRDEPGWEENTLSELAKPVTNKAEATDPSHVLTLSGEHGLVLQSEYFGKRVAGTSSERYTKLARNDFVYNDRTTKESPWGTIKRLSRYDSGIVSPIYKCFRFAIGENPVFWDWYFASGSHNAELRGMVNEGARAGRFNISIDKFLDTSVWHPSNSEQRKIAECLSSLDEVIAAQVRKVEAFKIQKKGLMQQLFPCDGEMLPQIRFPEFFSAAGWSSQELGLLTTKIGSGITPTGGEKNYKSDGRPFIRSQNVGWGEWLLDDVAYIDEQTHRAFSSTEIAHSDVLLNITGASIGRSALADARVVGGNVNQHVCVIRVKQDVLNPALLNQYLISDLGQKQIDSFQAGGNRQGLNFGQIRSFLIPLPPTEREQKRIADLLTTLDVRIAAQSETLKLLRIHKAGLMQQLFPSPEKSGA